MKLTDIYRKTMIATAITSVIIISAAAYYSFITAKAAPDTVPAAESVEDATAEKHPVASNDGNALSFGYEQSDSQYIWIPLPDGKGAEDVNVENHYIDGQLWVTINDNCCDFYKSAVIDGDTEGISDGNFYFEGGKTVLKLDMDHVWEYNTIYEDGVIYIEKTSPDTVYDRIVMLDPAGYVPDELLRDDSISPEKICIDIASRAKELLEAENIKVYVTGTEENGTDDEKKILLAEDIHPDYYVRIQTSYSEDSGTYGTGTVYNGTYFIPGFGSAELADLLEQYVTTDIGGRVEGMSEAGENDTVIRKATIPAASLNIGYYTNTQENVLLNRDDYRQKIAKGIYDAIMYAYND